jgi:hypothetical protein
VLGEDVEVKAVGRPRDVPARTTQAFHDAQCDRIGHGGHDDGNRSCRVFRRDCSGRRRREDDVDVCAYEFVGERGQPVEPAFGEPVVDRDVSAFGPSELAQAIPKGVDDASVRCASPAGQEAKAIDLAAVLRRRARRHTDADEQHEQHQLFRGAAHG